MTGAPDTSPSAAGLSGSVISIGTTRLHWERGQKPRRYRWGQPANRDLSKVYSWPSTATELVAFVGGGDLFSVFLPTDDAGPA